MPRKIASVSIVLALLIAMISSSAGLAASTTTTVFGNRYGKVTAVVAGSITIENLAGVDKTILVSSTTKFYGVNGVKKSLGDVRVGSWIFASGTVGSAHDLAANNIILVGARFVGAAYWDFPNREFGTVISVVPLYGEFFMHTALSGTVKVITDENTVFVSKKVKSVAKISEGMKAVVAGPMTTNGFIRAKIVIVFSPARRSR